MDAKRAGGDRGLGVGEAVPGAPGVDAAPCNSTDLVVVMGSACACFAHDRWGHREMGPVGSGLVGGGSADKAWLVVVRSRFSGGRQILGPTCQCWRWLRVCVHEGREQNSR
jgi:hypothetical protein